MQFAVEIYVLVLESSDPLMPTEVCHDLEREQQSEGKELPVSERECEREVRSEFKYAVGLSIALWLAV